MSFAQLLLSLRMMTDFIGSSSRESINTTLLLNLHLQLKLLQAEQSGS